MAAQGPLIDVLHILGGDHELFLDCLQPRLIALLAWYQIFDFAFTFPAQAVPQWTLQFLFLVVPRLWPVALDAQLQARLQVIGPHAVDAVLVMRQWLRTNCLRLIDETFKRFLVGATLFIIAMWAPDNLFLMEPFGGPTARILQLILQSVPFSASDAIPVHVLNFEFSPPNLVQAAAIRDRLHGLQVFHQLAMVAARLGRSAFLDRGEVHHWRTARCNFKVMVMSSQVVAHFDNSSVPFGANQQLHVPQLGFAQMLRNFFHDLPALPRPRIGRRHFHPNLWRLQVACAGVNGMNGFLATLHLRSLPGPRTDNYHLLSPGMQNAGAVLICVFGEALLRRVAPPQHRQTAINIMAQLAANAGGVNLAELTARCAQLHLGGSAASAELPRVPAAGNTNWFTQVNLWLAYAIRGAPQMVP